MTLPGWLPEVEYRSLDGCNLSRRDELVGYRGVVVGVHLHHVLVQAYMSVF